MRARKKVPGILFPLSLVFFLSFSRGVFPIPLGLLGTWEGTLATGLTSFRVAMVLQRGPGGTSLASFNNIDDGIYDQPFQKSSFTGHSFHGELPTGESLDLTVDGSGQSLRGTYRQGNGSFQVSGKISPLVLRRGGDFLSPRVGPDGKPPKAYRYRPPGEMGDGWETGEAGKEGMDARKLAGGITRVLEGALPHFHSVLVARHGKLLLDEYFYGYGPRDKHPLQSATKSVFSLLFGIARDRGLVEPGQGLYDFFPGYASKPGWDPRKGRITLEMLLTMRSGFRCDDWKDSQACSWDMARSPDWLRFALSQPMGGEPGGHFAYCGACLTPLSAILARQSGMGVPAFAQKYLFDPLGIRDTAWMEGPGGITPVSFGLSLRPRDLAKLGELVLRKGEWGGTRVVSGDWIGRSTAAQVRRKPREGDADYGYLWWEREMRLNGKTARILDAWGVGGQHLFVAPGLDLVCVITGGNYKDGKLGANSLKFFREYVLGSLIMKGSPAKRQRE